MDGTLWCQWVSPPSDSDQNIVDVSGAQSKYGHHVILYGTTLVEPVGTSRPCTTADMVSIRYLGLVGGEGAGGPGSKLPDGVVLRQPKGQALMLNVHFLNLGTTAIQGQAVVDVKTEAPNPNDRVAGFFNNTALSFSVPANQHSTFDRTCPIGADMDYFMFANHMHNFGVSAVTTVTHADGGSEVLAADDTWQAEEQFNPSWTRWQLDAPMPVRTGDTMTTHCEWTNTSSADAPFPTEMCVGIGFYLPPGGGDGQDIYCVDGQWSVGSPP